MSKSNLPGVDEKSYSTYPWDKKGKQAKDHFERKEFKGFYVSRSGLIFDKRGKYRPPNFRYNLDGEIHKRRLRITEDGKRKEYGYKSANSVCRWYDIYGFPSKSEINDMNDEEWALI